MSKLIGYIESKGFKVVGRNILKRSESTRQLKTVGSLNDNNFFFYSDNVHPFKAGVNFFNDTSITDNNSHKEYIAKVKENERSDFEIDFENYHNATKENSTFNTFLNNTTRKFISKNSYNFFDLRGIRKGYMEGSVCFPFIDIDNKFKTAQIIKYGSNGKRIKSAFSTNWFHSYKPIKSSLGLKENDKYSVQVDCFFGENHLKHSSNIVAIVEAPKTAVILKEIYPNIDWIATAGEQALFSKDLTVLEDRKVVLFADAHTTKWKEFAGKKGFNYCDILDIEGIEAGSDIADFIFEESSTVFEELHNYIFSLNAGEFDLELNKDLLELDFRVVKEEQGYFTAVPYQYNSNDIIHKKDNSKTVQVDFEGKHFQIYKEKYEILNANIDWHKQDRKENNKMVGMDKDSFVWHLQKCFRTLKYLNADLGKEIYLDVFEKTLTTLLRESNFRFNKSYVLSRLVPIWESYNADLNRFKKHRNWKYKGSKQLTRKEFEKELNNDKYRAKLNMRILAFDDVLKEKRFIDIETDLCLSPNQKSRGFDKIFNLVKKYNTEVIGAGTLKNYLSRQDFFDKLDKCTKNYPPHIKSLYRVGKNWYSKLPLSKITDITGYKNRSYIKQWLTFEADRDTETIIRNEVEMLLNNINLIEPMRNCINEITRIYTFEIIEVKSDKQMLIDAQQDWNTAFLSEKELNKELKQIDTVNVPPALDKEIFVAGLKSVIKYEINYLKYLEALRNKKITDNVIRLPDASFKNELDKFYSSDAPKMVVNF